MQAEINDLRTALKMALEALEEASSAVEKAYSREDCDGNIWTIEPPTTFKE
jgi:hypothetical protein